jgi:hypothetical protein
MLKEILTISGQPGLYKLVSQTKSVVIVESLETGKRMPVYGSSKVSSLEDIAIYTYSKEMPLQEIFRAIAAKENMGKLALDKNSPSDEFKLLIESVLPDYDKERVYVSDIKKMAAWYNLLNDAGIIKQIAESPLPSEADVPVEAGQE